MAAAPADRQCASSKAWTAFGHYPLNVARRPTPQETACKGTRAEGLPITPPTMRPLMRTVRWTTIGIGAVCMLVSAQPLAMAQSADKRTSKDEDARRPKVVVRVQPPVVVAPGKVTLTVELQGG